MNRYLREIVEEYIEKHCRHNTLIVAEREFAVRIGYIAETDLSPTKPFLILCLKDGVYIEITRREVELLYNN